MVYWTLKKKNMRAIRQNNVRSILIMESWDLKTGKTVFGAPSTGWIGIYFFVTCLICVLFSYSIR